MLYRSKWSHSIENYTENFLGPCGGFGNRYKAHLWTNPGRKTLKKKKKVDFLFTLKAYDGQIIDATSF